MVPEGGTYTSLIELHLLDAHRRLIGLLRHECLRFALALFVGLQQCAFHILHQLLLLDLLLGLLVLVSAVLVELIKK